MTAPADERGARYADPDRCPDCAAALHRPLTVCDRCGLPLTGEDAARLFATLQIADQYLARLRFQAGTARTAAATAAPTGPPVWESRPDLTVRPQVRWTVPAVLLALGAACLTVGALVFLAVTWSVLGVGGRTAVLLMLTGVAVLVTHRAARRGLRGASEAFSVLAGTFAAFDLAGAYHAGWLGDLDLTSAVVLGGATLAMVSGAGNAALRRSSTGPLVGPQLVAATGLGAAAVAAAGGWSFHLTAVLAVAAAVLVAAALAARRTGQDVLATAAAGGAAVTWFALVVVGLARVGLAAGDVRADDTAPWLVAAGYAAIGLGFALSIPLARGWQVASGVSAYALVVGVLTAQTASTTTGVVVVTAAAGLVAAGATVALLAAGHRTAADAAVTATVAAIGCAAAAAGLTLTWLAALVAGVSDALIDGASSLSATFTPVSTAATTAPWTTLLAAAAVAAALLAARTPAPIGVWAPVAAAAGGAALLGYVPYLLAVVAVAASLAGLHLVARRVGSGPRWFAWTGAAGWASIAAAVSSFHPATLLAVTTAACAVAGLVAFRGAAPERPVAAVCLAPLAGATTAALAWLVDASTPWSAVATIVVTGATATALATGGRGPAWWRDGVALSGCGLAAVAGTVAASADRGEWAAGYLVLLGVGSAALALAGRSMALAVLATAFEVAALWVRLAVAEVETPEAYTLPLAAVLLGYGGWWLRRDRSLGTMRALMPGLAVGLAPSLVLAAGDPVSLRAALLALGCGVLVAIGAVARLRAPLLAGAGAGLVLVIAELAPYHDAVPRWVTLSAAGTVLLIAGVRWEHLANAGRRNWGRLGELG